MEVGRKILRDDVDVFDLGIEGMRDGDVDEAVSPSEGDGGFASSLCQWKKAGALSSS